MSIFDLFGLDIEKLQQLLTRWNINVNAVYLQAVIDIFLFVDCIFILQGNKEACEVSVESYSI